MCFHPDGLMFLSHFKMPQLPQHDMQLDVEATAVMSYLRVLKQDTSGPWKNPSFNVGVSSTEQGTAIRLGVPFVLLLKIYSSQFGPCIDALRKLGVRAPGHCQCTDSKK